MSETQNRSLRAGTSSAAERGQAGALRAACARTGSSDQGVSSDEVLVGVADIDLVDPQIKNQFGFRSDTRDVVGALVDDINRHGGVACRKLAVKIYKIDPFSPSQQREQCLQATRIDRVFAFLDPGFLSTLATQKCVTAEHRVPLLNTYPWPASYVREQAPYFLSTNVDGDAAARNWVHSASASGLFDRAKGFRTLGLLYCEGDGGLAAQIRRSLAEVGVTSIKANGLQCENGVTAPPAEITRAAVTDRQAGVTHVFPATANLNVEVYLRAATSQDYHPVYSASDLYGLTFPAFTEDFDPRQWAGVVGFTSSRSGELRNGRPAPETVRCDRVLRARLGPGNGIASEWDDLPRVYCDLLHLLTAGLAGAGSSPTRSSFSQAVQSAGRLSFSGVSDGLYDGPGSFTGADFTRSIVWRPNDSARSCDRGSRKSYASNGCWFLLDPVFRRRR